MSDPTQFENPDLEPNYFSFEAEQTPQISRCGVLKHRRGGVLLRRKRRQRKRVWRRRHRKRRSGVHVALHGRIKRLAPAENRNLLQAVAPGQPRIVTARSPERGGSGLRQHREARSGSRPFPLVGSGKLLPGGPGSRDMVVVVIIITAISGTPPLGKLRRRSAYSFHQTVLRPQNLGCHGTKLKEKFKNKRKSGHTSWEANKWKWRRLVCVFEREKKHGVCENEGVVLENGLVEGLIYSRCRRRQGWGLRGLASHRPSNKPIWRVTK